jgi:2-C-methyl-D-erythritol 4-phosphate cytidylyltransferase/2-C-methyl-D-erythritol 2,4-cyclodiphosphate synthase
LNEAHEPDATSPVPPADVIVVAAGGSQRMGGIDKLLAPIGGRPLLSWTLKALAERPPIDRIVLVVAPQRVAEWRAAAWLPEKVATIIEGGPRRQDSVAAGVGALIGLGADRDRVVLVHDGARPAVSPVVVLRVIRATAEHGAAIPLLPIDETIKRVGRGGVIAETVDRIGLATAQTPQGARLGLLEKAFSEYPPGSDTVFTDEAALLAACRIPVHAVPGHRDNLKVTHPIDLSRAARVIDMARPRVGYGRDRHAFGPGSPLVLGGLQLDGAPRLRGHSDGDVVLHAVADALLGAAGMGDLGRHYPSDARTPEGVDSGELVTEVISRIYASGLGPGYVDVTITAARPRLGEKLDAMRARIAELLWVHIDQVSVKASTGNLTGMEGAGRGVSAEAVATLIDHR